MFTLDFSVGLLVVDVVFASPGGAGEYLAGAAAAAAVAAPAPDGVVAPDPALESSPLAATRAGANESSLVAMTGGNDFRRKESKVGVEEVAVDQSY